MQSGSTEVREAPCKSLPEHSDHFADRRHVLKENKRVVVNDVVNRAFGNVDTDQEPQQEAA